MPTKKGYKKSYYGKRPLWQWIVLYVVIGIIVYGLVYYFVFAKNSSGYKNPYNTSVQQNYNHK